MPPAPRKLALRDLALPHKVLAYLRRYELLRPGDRVGVAVSGGADSVGLLRLLLELRDELGVILSVVHFHHKIRGADADADERFVTALAQHYRLRLHCGCGDAPAHAKSQGQSLETAARELRYAWFREVLSSGAASKIATAHTLDDQAETVLLRLMRGAWTRGLAGIYPKLPVAGCQPAEGQQQVPGSARDDKREIIRPLLEIRRSELETYLRSLNQDWREDASNRDLKHARNRVRHVLLPLLEREFNPAIRQVLAETAEIARAEEEYWNSLPRPEATGISAEVGQKQIPRGLKPTRNDKEIDKESVVDGAAKAAPLQNNTAAPKRFELQPGAVVAAGTLCGQPLALRRRLIRSVAEQLGMRLEFQQVEAILRLAEGDGRNDGRNEGRNDGRNPVELPEGWRVVRRQTRADKRHAAGPVLLFEKHEPAQPQLSGYEYHLPVPGEIRIPETGKCIRAQLLNVPSTGANGVRAWESSGYNRDQLLDPLSLGSELRVRNWRPGDRFWPAHTKSPKKVKELLQGRHISGRERVLWPVVVSGDQLVWMRGFSVPEQFAVKPGAVQALRIDETEAGF